jgi:hypothetical protein
VKHNFAGTSPSFSNATRRIEPAEKDCRSLTTREAHELFRKAQELETRTKKPGRKTGVLGTSTLLVYHTLIFTFQNRATVLYRLLT